MLIEILKIFLSLINHFLKTALKPITMRRFNKLHLSILIYIIACIVLIFSARSCINSKDNRLKAEATENLDNFFSEHEKLVTTEYSDENASYKSTPSSEYYNIASGEEGFSKWVDLYGLYILTGEQGKYGWALNIFEKLDEGFSLSQIHPSLVGFKRDYYSMVRPHSVKGAVNRFYKFYTADDKSEYSKYVNEDVSVEDINEAISNDYYEIVLSEKLDKDTKSKKYIFAEDRDYIVVSSIATVAKYQLQYRAEENPKGKDLRNTLIWGFVILTLLLGLSIAAIILLKERLVKQETETLKDKLLRLCNPSQFMKPYDEKKVSLANDLYEKINNTDEEDLEKLRLLRQEAEKTLGINFFDKKLLKTLLYNTNPKHYMKPYNAEKVRIANQLHMKLKKGNISVEELESIEREIQEKLI